MIFSLNLSFYFIFLCFLIFLSSICYDVLFFVGFYVNDLNSSAISIKQKSHIKSLIVSVFHHTLNLMYFIHVMITSCVDLKPFLLDISLDVMSSSNVFNDLIFMFRCKCIIILNQYNFNFHCKK